MFKTVNCCKRYFLFTWSACIRVVRSDHTAFKKEDSCCIRGGFRRCNTGEHQFLYCGHFFLLSDWHGKIAVRYSAWVTTCAELSELCIILHTYVRSLHYQTNERFFHSPTNSVCCWDNHGWIRDWRLPMTSLMTADETTYRCQGPRRCCCGCQTRLSWTSALAVCMTSPYRTSCWGSTATAACCSVNGPCTGVGFYYRATRILA